MDLKKLIETLHPLELKVVPHLAKNDSLDKVAESSGLSEVEAMRALQWLENKGALKIVSEEKELVQLEDNGRAYAEKGLPEKRFLSAVAQRPLRLDKITEAAQLSKEELNVCLGQLKKKAAISIDKGEVSITDQGKKLAGADMLEESLLKRLTKEKVLLSSLKPEEKFAFDNLMKRKSIIGVLVEKTKRITLSDTGKKLTKADLSEVKDSVETLSQSMLKDGSWKGKKFRRYDVTINVPSITRGKRHFVNQATEYARKVWIEMGFKEMSGNMLNTSFWNFDALFTAQDHPVRDLQDTFYIGHPIKGKLPGDKMVKEVKDMHEKGGNLDSKGWQYEWAEDDALKNVLRTHTTVLSAQTLASLKKEDLPAKFFAVGKCFRNETVDWSHLFEFNQTEGIVVDPNANFKHLLGYLKRFFAKLGFPKARFRPAYFPYTEPSVEIDVYHPVRKQWVELGGAGIFRPEVVVPLLGEDIPVLAWGPGFDRIMMDYYKITDLRELYKNDIKQLREMKEWMY